MNIDSTFDVGQDVWHVWDRIRRTVETCSVCKGAGKVPVVGVGTLIDCPKCWRKGEMETGEQYVEHVVSADPLTVGLVRVSVEGPTAGAERSFTNEVDRSNMGPRSYKRTEEYMCVQTGVGSGRVYRLEDLFTSHAEAQLAARARTQASLDSATRYDEVEALA